MARKTGLNKRALVESERAFQAWLHDRDETPLQVFIAQVYRSGYRFGKKVGRNEAFGKWGAKRGP